LNSPIDRDEQAGLVIRQRVLLTYLENIRIGTPDPHQDLVDRDTMGDDYPQVMMEAEPASGDEHRVYEASVWYRNADGTVDRLADWTHQTMDDAVAWMHRRDFAPALTGGLTGTIITLRRHTITWQAPQGSVTETFWQPIHFDGYVVADYSRLDHVTSAVGS